MVKEMAKEEVEKLRKQRSAFGVLLIVLLGAGLVIVIFPVLMAAPYATLVDDEHITDQDMPIRDMDNATYTWTAEELSQEIAPNLWIMGIGLGLVVAGYSMMLVFPSGKALHKLGCNGDGDWKYCPECGIKLSELDKK